MQGAVGPGGDGAKGTDMAGSLQASLCQGSSTWPLGKWEKGHELRKGGLLVMWQAEDRRNNLRRRKQQDLKTWCTQRSEMIQRVWPG